MTEDEVRAIVRTSVAEGLFLTEDEVAPETTLFSDLAAESIDLLDILFRLEQAFGIRLKGSDISDYILGDLSPEELVDADGGLTEQGRAQLTRTMPQVDVSAIGPGADIMSLMGLFSVQNLTDLVMQRVASVPG
ncbi:MAG: phosphopantetheine-binding protein [Actinomycetota bacterium]|nr:phosphopantetheine-binding protein [Actinomycetota bacterium]